MELVLYTRPGCHLCDEMKTVIAARRRHRAVVLTEIDISTDASLERRYGRDIPVLLLNGKEVARHRLEAQDLDRMLGA